jgi:hypothetical protein
MLEQEIQQLILARLGARLDLTVWRNNTGVLTAADGRPTRFGLVGSADVIGLAHPGLFVAIEVKRPGGKLSPQQAKFRAMVEGLGGVYVLAFSVEQAAADLDAALAKRRAQWT